MFPKGEGSDLTILQSFRLNFANKSPLGRSTAAPHNSTNLNTMIFHIFIANGVFRQFSSHFNIQ